MVASHTGDIVRTWDPLFANGTELSGRYFNLSYPGIFNSKAANYAPQPVPNVLSLVNGRTALPSIVATWVGQEYKTYYYGQLEIPDGSNPPVYYPYRW